MLKARCLTLVTIVILSGTTACGSAGQPAPYDASGIDGLVIPTPRPDPADFARRVDNPWLALEDAGDRDYLSRTDGEAVGKLGLEVTSTDVTVAGLRATAVRSTRWLRGEGRERVTRYYAQDREGNVWLVGEDGPQGQWRTGEGTPAGLAMPATPRLGDGWVLAAMAGEPARTVRVVADPGTPSPDSVTIEEIETGVRTSYVKDIGVVRIQDGTRTVELID